MITVVSRNKNCFANRGLWLEFCSNFDNETAVHAPRRSIVKVIKEQYKKNYKKVFQIIFFFLHLLA